MNIYYELMGKPVFSINDVNEYYHNMNSARSAVKTLVRNNLAVRIRNNLYTCISGETHCSVANKYQIACAIHPDAYVSHHSALEYYGLYNQVFYDMYVSSSSKFTNFEFDGNEYCYVPSNMNKGIEYVEFSDGVRITSMERTVLDSIKDMDKIAGVEEVVSCLSNIGRLNESIMIEYLDIFNNQFLYQKTGYLLYPFQSQMQLSDAFFDLCKSKKGKSMRYLTNETTKGIFNKEWSLIIPRYL